MSMFNRFRSRREAARRVRAIERALNAASSHTVREEIRAMAQYQYR